MLAKCKITDMKDEEQLTPSLMIKVGIGRYLGHGSLTHSRLNFLLAELSRRAIFYTLPKNYEKDPNIPEHLYVVRRSNLRRS